MRKSVSRKGFVAAAAAAVLTVALAGCGGSGGGEAADTSGAAEGGTSAAAVAPAASGNGLRFVTGGESGTYYAFGTVIANHATNDAGVPITALVGNGSQANIMELQDGNAELAFCQSDVMAYAYDGTNLFEGAPVDTFSTVACLYDEQVQIVTCDPEIKTVADLAGKRVSIGDAGSGVYFNAIDILGAYGLTEADIVPQYLGFGDSANDLKDGKIDAAFVVAGAPTTAITDLSTSKQAYLVALDDEHVDALLETSPYYTKTVIPAGTYTGIDEDITTVSVGAVVLANDTVSEDDVYALVADIFDNAETQVDAHAKYAELSVEKGASVTSVPYHPGAAKYFDEQGISVPTK